MRTMPRRSARLTPPLPDPIVADEMRLQAAAVVTSANRVWSLSRLATMLGLITIPVVVLDQATKLYIATHLPLYSMRAIVPNWLDLTYTLNPGAAFSLFANMPAAMRGIFFIVLSFIAIVVLIVLLARRTTSSASGLAFALILGGTIGNLIDRLARGRVIDFIYFHHDSFSYPVFNVADSTITIGVAIILLMSFSTGRAHAINSSNS
jgi:signal peptidase II